MADLQYGAPPSAVSPMERVEVVSSPGSFANPAPLGLLGYGMSTVLLSIANVGWFELGPMVLAMAVFFGGIAQMIVAVLAFRRGETFSVTAFGGFAFLWLTFAFMLLGNQNNWWSTQNSSTALGWYLALWAVFSLGMTVASLSAPRVLTGVLALTVALLALLAVANWADSSAWTKAGGWEGIVTGAAAMYTAFAFLVNESLSRTVLPVGTPLLTAPAAAPQVPRQRSARPTTTPAQEVHP